MAIVMSRQSNESYLGLTEACRKGSGSLYTYPSLAERDDHSMTTGNLVCLEVGISQTYIVLYACTRNGTALFTFCEIVLKRPA
jgi:hypothetical protein